MNTKHKGFTLIEVFTVAATIAILISILIPSITMVKKKAKETQQRAQITSLEMALEAFKGDYGDYPPSFWYDDRNLSGTQAYQYCGAQKLAEALMGRDLLGFHPDSQWIAPITQASNSPYYLDNLNDNQIEQNMKQRVGPYLEDKAANAFRLFENTSENLPGLYNESISSPLYKDTYVLCDVYNKRRITLQKTDTVENVWAGTPILYYKANTTSRTIADSVTDLEDRIYNAWDNAPMVQLGPLTRSGSTSSDIHWLLGDGTGDPPVVDEPFDYFYYDYLLDAKKSTPNWLWPHNPDTYILISAGADGLYGTDDDITNFN